MAQKPLSNVLIKPAGPDCNLGCRYCFYLCKEDLFGADAAHRMSAETLAALTEQLCADGGSTVTFCWQGGEPTLMGLDFFRQAAALQKEFRRPDQQVGNALQTNGWVIDAEWARFLRDERFLVGLSIDGPAHVHDRYRRTRNDKPTHERVEAVARLLLEGGVDVNALTVVNDYSVRFGGEIYDYLVGLGFKFLQFIPCLPVQGEAGDDAPEPPEPEAYGDFLIETFDRWRRDFHDGLPTISLRHLESLFSSYVHGPPLECSLARTCGDYVVVEHSGEVFSCDFYVEPDWKLGRLSEGQLGEMLNSAKQKEFGARKAALPERCGTCRWLPHCRGGCPADRAGEGDEAARMRLCAGYQRFLEYADGFMRSLADRWLAQRRAAAAQEERARRTRGRAAVSRNAPCPCGSGRKFKHCCGAGR